MDWQYHLLKEIFQKFGEQAKSISTLSPEDILAYKKPYLPESLYKFYAPTLENLSDVANERLWLASPSSFNDPKDCQMTIAENFEAYVISKLIQNSPNFTKEERVRINRDSERIGKDSKYCPLYHYILSQKIETISKPIYDEVSRFKHLVEEFIKTLKTTNYRIACFSERKSDYFSSDTLMWAHYAQSYKGFCVEYDVKKMLSTIFSYYSYYNCGDNNFTSGKIDGNVLNKIFSNGLFPVVYKSKQISIPAATSFYIAQDKCSAKYINNVQLQFLKSLLTKDLIWRYEQEWRLIVDESLVEPVGFKIPFPFAKRIIVGDSASPELKLLLKQVADKLNLGKDGYLGYSTESKIYLQ